MKRIVEPFVSNEILEAGGWIATEEKIPEPNKVVQVIMEHGVFDADLTRARSGEKRWYVFLLQEWFDLEDIPYWRPK